MDKEQLIKKLYSLIQDPNFILKLSETKSNEEAAKLFADNGCETSADEVKLVRDTLNDLLDGKIEVSKEDLENVAGGVDASTVLAHTLRGALFVGVVGLLLSNSASSSDVPLTEEQKIRAQAMERVAMNKMGRGPTNLQKFWGMFSTKQAGDNEIATEMANIVAEKKAAAALLPPVSPSSPQ